ncbi:hypothetical protein BGZ47_011279 [Haplosporangium gracile]|nr:hypothetical protein BGZ47_011279 [Haplosporangium gracile]
MLYSMTVGMLICIEIHFGKQGRWFPMALTAWLSYNDHFSTISGTLQFVSFQINYVCMILGGFYFLRIFHVYRRTILPNAAASHLIRLITASLIATGTVWLIYYRLCIYVIGVGPEVKPTVPHLSVLIMYYHYDMREMGPEIVLWKGFLSTVTLKSVGKRVA